MVKGGHEILVDVIDNWVATIQFARICGAVTLSETAITIGSSGIHIERNVLFVVTSNGRSLLVVVCRCLQFGTCCMDRM